MNDTTQTPAPAAPTPDQQRQQLIDETRAAADALDRAVEDVHGKLQDATQALRKAAYMLEVLSASLRNRTRQRDERDQVIQHLQRALAFWMPGVPAAEHPARDRLAADSWLLVGFAGELEQTAEERGWLSLQPNEDTRRLDSGAILLDGSGSLGEPIESVWSGVDLRQAIDRGIEVERTRLR